MKDITFRASAARISGKTAGHIAETCAAFVAALRDAPMPGAKEGT